MTNMITCDPAVRDTKAQVKKAIREAGKWTGAICPSNTRYNNPWGTTMFLTFTSLEELEEKLNRFTYYNCNSEAGRYIHFYPEVKTKPDLTALDLYKGVFEYKYTAEGSAEGELTNNIDNALFPLTYYLLPGNDNADYLVDILAWRFNVSEYKAMELVDLWETLEKEMESVILKADPHIYERWNNPMKEVSPSLQDEVLEWIKGKGGNRDE